jgi:hypothetical protein
MVSPIVVPEGGRFSIAKRDLSGGPEGALSDSLQGSLEPAQVR